MQQQHPNNTNRFAIIKWTILAIILVVVFFVYKNYNPSNSNYFPKCPVLQATGYKCAGCGSQRAVHALLNLDIKQAMYYNLILVLFIPYLVLGAFFDLKKIKTPKQQKWHGILYGTKAVWIVFIIIVAFWIFRNTPFWNWN